MIERNGGGPGGPGPIRYRLTMGAGWRRIRLDEHAAADVGAYLDAVFATVPADVAGTARDAIETRLTAQIMAGRARGGIDFYVPVPGDSRAGSRPALTVLTAEVKIPGPVTAVPEPTEVVARVAAANPTARTGVVAGMPAVRIDRSGTAPAGDGAETAAAQPRRGPRHIEYILPVAGDPDHRWLSLALTGQAGPNGDERAVDIAVAVFDRAVAELIWE